MEASAADRCWRRLHRSELSVPRRTRLQPVPCLMRSKYQLYDRSRLRLKPLSERVHDLHVDRWLALDDATPEFTHADLAKVASRLHSAQSAGAARVLIMGAHV